VGGGVRKIKETRKSRNLVPARWQGDGTESVETGSGSAGSSGGAVARERPSPCEQEHVVAFRVVAEAAALGVGVEVMLDAPAELVAAGETVGILSDVRQSQTLSACLASGYRFFGGIVAIDRELGEGLATVAGVPTEK
jgi:hypothetical protein